MPRLEEHRVAKEKKIKENEVIFDAISVLAYNIKNKGEVLNTFIKYCGKETIDPKKRYPLKNPRERKKIDKNGETKDGRNDPLKVHHIERMRKREQLGNRLKRENI